MVKKTFSWAAPKKHTPKRLFYYKQCIVQCPILIVYEIVTLFDPFFKHLWAVLRSESNPWTLYMLGKYYIVWASDLDFWDKGLAV